MQPDKTLLLISSRIPHYRVSVYNYFHRRFREEGWEFKVASNAIQPHSKLEVRFDFREVEFQFSKYRKLLAEMRPDVVMFHLLLKERIFWFLIHWLKFKGVPMIQWTKGANLDKPSSRIRYHVFNHFHRLSDALILYSPREIAHIKPAYHGKVFVANNTVNFEDYPEVTASKQEIKTEFGIPFEKIVLFTGTMGVDGERKKVEHLIRIFRDLDRKDVGLVIVGSGMNEGLKQQINPGNTRVLGAIHDARNLNISKMFKAADLYVVPGHVGLGLNQAFYWGVPALTEAGHQPPEIQYLKSGRNGFMVPENDVAGLKEKMLYLLDHDDVRAQFSKHAREDILKEASIEGMFQSFQRAVAFVRRQPEPTASPTSNMAKDVIS